MNLLFVTDVYPYPPHVGSALIAFHWARLLARRHCIHVASAQSPESADALLELEELGIKSLNLGHAFIRSRGARHAASWMPMAMHRVRAREFYEAIKEAKDIQDFDAVIIVSAGLGALLPLWKRLPRVVFVPYDAESLNYAMRARLGRGPLRRLYFQFETLKWELAQARLYPLADACVAVSDEDREAIASRWQKADQSRIHVIPNGVETTFFSPMPSRKDEGRILISGNMASTDTEISLRWFFQTVLPLIRQHLPDASVEIIGRDPLPSLRALTGQIRNVHLRGFVPDLRPYLARASVYVAPLLLGSGVKNRVLEAMAMGKPVVATPLGIRGLRVRPGQDVLTATTADAFALAVVDLLRNEDLRKRIGQAAREVIVAHHSWVSVADRVEGMLGDLIGGRRDGRYGTVPNKAER